MGQCEYVVVMWYGLLIQCEIVKCDRLSVSCDECE